MLSDWIRELPEENFRATPWLTYWLGVAILPFDPADARRLFEESLPRFRQDGDAAGAFLVLFRNRLGGLVRKVGYETTTRSFPPWTSSSRSSADFSSLEIEARALCGLIQALANWLPITVDGDAWIARARAVAEGISDPSLKGALLTNVLSYLASGSIPER